jgi:hypothetical protein
LQPSHNKNQTNSENASSSQPVIFCHAWRSEDDLRPLAGTITVLTSFLMAMFGAAYFSTYLSSLNPYMNRIGIIYPALYIGSWNLATFAICLASGILLIKRKYLKISVIGIILQLIAGIVPLLVSQIYQNGFFSIALIAALPLLFASTGSLIFVAASKK